uniref:Quinolinate synthase n=1 Tax=Candidatus Kentrum sp. FM TaxID=2126340 RepID=A0A450WDZ8_9GAMM|nr:MAG: quinolinate synthase [Candidatus Kentron sp. FM]VFJ63549.1 MAG: quinolinate synthase [Candidatus Kentron sp. FM]VFK15191.1 MAG: quinolinate synthase [Candidatus Kentron sp. FM]
MIIPTAQSIANKAPVLSPTERESLFARARSLLTEHDAALLAHYYTQADLQILAEETGGFVGDSLEMARFGKQHKANTLVVAGVRFMGETAKILNPEKRILIPDADADCSLDLGCPSDEFSALCDAHPGRTVVVYANTSAQVKARADWVVTSGSALAIIEHLDKQGEKILWAPDRFLGAYVQRMTGADILLWQGSCIVHEQFDADALQALMDKHPDAIVLVHPESPPEVAALAHIVGSTTALIDAVTKIAASTFIVATDVGIFHKMRQAAPEKTFIAAPAMGENTTGEGCAHCPWMAMNSLGNLVSVLESGHHEIHVDEALRQRAALPLHRLLEFTKQ